MKQKPIYRDLLKRPGLMAGEISVPDDFDTMDVDEIEDLFGGTKD